MQKKYRTFAKFCEFKSFVEKDTRRKVKYIRSDNNGEYMSNEFKNLCVVEGIKRELTTPKNPQRKGWPKRRIK